MKNKSYSKMVAIFALLLAMATSVWFAAPAMLCYAQGGYVVVEGGGAGIPHPSFTSFRGKIDTSGVLTNDVTAKSPDKLCQLTIKKDTKALDKKGNPLSGIIIIEMRKPPPLCPNANVISLVYDLAPDRATFDPPITLTFTYDPALIPEDVAEENLLIAMWDEEAGECVNLVSTVDPVSNTVTARISHFTAFAVVAYTHPAAFAATDLVIAPDEVNIGETVTVSALVTNTGDLTTSYKVTLKIDNVAVATKEVTLVGGASQKVTFTTSRDTARTYAVNVDGLSGTLVVKTPPVPPVPPAPPPPAPPPAPPVAPPVTPPAPPVTPPTAVNWWLIGGIIAAVIIIGVVIALVIRRRMA